MGQKTHNNNITHFIRTTFEVRGIYAVPQYLEQIDATGGLVSVHHRLLLHRTVRMHYQAMYIILNDER